jgi:hypothetical protein
MTERLMFDTDESNRLLTTLLKNLFAQRWTRLPPYVPKGRVRYDTTLQYPGVYILSYTDIALANTVITVDDIFYVGMTTRALKDRLNEFRKGIEKDDHHSSAMRFYKHFANNTPFSEWSDRKHFYYAAVPVECNSNKLTATADDWRKMGCVACLEYYVIAEFMDKKRNRPLLNLVERRGRSKASS